jgi:hypothetical protein
MIKALCFFYPVDYATLHECTSTVPQDTKGASWQTSPSWLPDDVRAPDPNSESYIVHLYINEDGASMVYDPETEVIRYFTAYG